ncbi:MAG: dienelactone hydrolase family protein [Burkholderiales bacterium]|nr:dienelactone hydrolase family protein [Burkholderiales bacterium]
MRAFVVLVVTWLLAFVGSPAIGQTLWGTPQFPQDKDRGSWWDADWWERGRLPVPGSFDVVEARAGYRSGEVEVPVVILRPAGATRPPVVLFLHGRRGIDELTRLVPLRLAARGFVVVVPDLYAGRFIAPFPVAHDRALDEDAARAVDFALALPDAQGQGRLCVVSHTRGGWYTLQALVARQRQPRAACIVAYYPHWQDPNAGEVAQVYQFAPEVEALTVPVLVFIGEHEQYQRARPIVAGIDALRAKGRDARLIVYPGVGRGFDFRGPELRTFADDLAAQDAVRRAAAFIRRHTP